MLSESALVGKELTRLSVGDLIGVHLSAIKHEVTLVPLSAGQRAAYERLYGCYQSHRKILIRLGFKPTQRAFTTTASGRRALVARRSAVHILATNRALEDALIRTVSLHCQRQLIIFAADSEQALRLAIQKVPFLTHRDEPLVREELRFVQGFEGLARREYERALKERFTERPPGARERAVVHAVEKIVFASESRSGQIIKCQGLFDQIEEIISAANRFLLSGRLKTCRSLLVCFDSEPRQIVKLARLRGLVCEFLRTELFGADDCTPLHHKHPAFSPVTAWALQSYLNVIRVSGPLALFESSPRYGSALLALFSQLSWCPRFLAILELVANGRESLEKVQMGDPLPVGSRSRKLGQSRACTNRVSSLG